MLRLWHPIISVVVNVGDSFLWVSMSHEAPPCLFWWLVVAVMYSESAPPSDVGVRGALSERLGDRTMDRSHIGSLCR